MEAVWGGVLVRGKESEGTYLRDQSAGKGQTSLRSRAVHCPAGLHCRRDLTMAGLNNQVQLVAMGHSDQSWDIVEGRVASKLKAI